MISGALFYAIGFAIGLSQFAIVIPAASSNSINWKAIKESGGSSPKVPNGFSIDQVQNPNWTPQPVNYTQLYANTLRKHKAPIPEEVYGGGVHARDFSLEPKGINSPATTMMDCGLSQFKWALRE